MRNWVPPQSARKDKATVTRRSTRQHRHCRRRAVVALLADVREAAKMESTHGRAPSFADLVGLPSLARWTVHGPPRDRQDQSKDSSESWTSAPLPQWLSPLVSPVLAVSPYPRMFMLKLQVTR